MASKNLHPEVDDSKQGKPGAASLSDAFMANLLSENSNGALINSSSEPVKTTIIQLDDTTGSSSTSEENVNRTDFANIFKGMRNATASEKQPDILSQVNVIGKDITSEEHSNEVQVVEEIVSTVDKMATCLENAQLETEVVEVEEIVSTVEKMATCLENAQLETEENKNFVPEVKEMESYRCDYESSSEDSSSTFSAGSSSDCSDSFFDEMYEKVKAKKNVGGKTKGEIEIHDLPPIEDLHITLTDKEMKIVGKVYAIVDNLVVVHSFTNMQPLNLDSVLFLTFNKPLGRIFDVFGPVIQPFYSVRFNNNQHIIDRGVTVDADVFFAPEHTDITEYVLVDQLRQQKGSDASWTDNNEPPPEFIDYSDDEQERAAKNKKRAKNRPASRVEAADNGVVPQKMPKETTTQRRQGSDIQPWENVSNAGSTNRSFAIPKRNFMANRGRPTFANIMLSKYNGGTSGNFQTTTFPPSSIPSSSTSLPYASQQNAILSQAHIRQSAPTSFSLRPAQPFLNQANGLLQTVPPQIPNTPPLAVNYRQIPPPSPSSQMQPWQRMNVQPVSRFVSQSMMPPVSAAGFPIYQQQSYVFGQVPTLGTMPSVPVSPVPFLPPRLVAVPFPAASPPPSAFFNQAPRQVLTVPNWQCGQSLSYAPQPMRVEPPNTPLRVQIPPNITSPPPVANRAYFVSTAPFPGS